DFLHRGEVALGRDRKAGLDDVDAHLVEELGDLELLLMGHGGARALLAVAQGGVEDEDAVLLGLRWRAHNVKSFSSFAPSLGRSVGFRRRGPREAPGRKTPSRPSGDDKEQEPAENEGAAGTGLSPPGDRADIAARRHYIRPRRARSRNRIAFILARRFLAEE